MLLRKYASFFVLFLIWLHLPSLVLIVVPCAADPCVRVHLEAVAQRASWGSDASARALASAQPSHAPGTGSAFSHALEKKKRFAKKKKKKKGQDFDRALSCGFSPEFSY